VEPPSLKNVSPIVSLTLLPAQKPGKFKDQLTTPPSVLLDAEVTLESEDSPSLDPNSTHTTPPEILFNAELITLWLQTFLDILTAPMLLHSEDYNAVPLLLPLPTFALKQT